MKTAAIFYTSAVLALGLPAGGAAQDSGSERTFRLSGVDMRSSLDSLMQWYHVSVIYLDEDVEGKSVDATCGGCSFEEALDRVLSGTTLGWVRIGNQVILKQREAPHSRLLSTIPGIVSDSLTGEWIAGATVVLRKSDNPADMPAGRWCPTNAYGFFSFRRIEPGSYVLLVRAVGYRSVTIHVVVAPDASAPLEIGMVQEDIPLQEVTVEGQRTALASAERFSRGLYLRSAPSDRNNYLLDGARIYNPSRYGGVLSTFNGEVLNDVQVKRGGVPPSYGGHVGGIVDLSLREGTLRRLSGSAGTGSLGSDISLEGPLNRTTSFIISGRRGYPDIAVPFVRAEQTPNHLGSSELIAKLTHHLSGSNQVSLNGYLGRDSYSNLVEGVGQRLGNNLSWGNSTLNVRWLGVAAPSLFLLASAVYTRYDFSLEHLLTDGLFPATNDRLSSDYAIEDIGVRAQAEHYYDQEHTVRGGVEFLHHRMQGDISAFSTQTASWSLQGVSSWEASVYLQDQWQMLPNVTAELGARATSFTGEMGSFSAVDPRFSLLVSLNETARIYGSFTAINQFVHPYRNGGVFLLYPTVFWYPSTERARPSTSLHFSLGVEKEIGENAFVVSAESYYRVTRNLHEFGLDSAGAPTSDFSGGVLLGTGRIYGIECSFRKRTGDLTSSLVYNLSWARETFAELNDGNEFSPRFDRRHELQIATWYTPAENWVCGLLCVLASDLSPSFTPRITAARSAGAALVADVLDLNEGRLPGFQRLELQVIHRFAVSRLPCQISLRFLNAYGLVDPFVWKLRASSDPRERWSAGLQDLKLFPLYPTLGVKVRF